METLKIEKSTARKLYPEVPKWFQEVLSDNFGKDFFSKKITDRIKTFEDACNEAGVTTFDVFSTSDSPDEVAYKKLKLIIKVLNEGWEPNWNDSNEQKWWPYFEWSSGSGFDFSASNFAYDCAFTAVGSRLCFKTRELAQYAGSQFIEIYRDFLTIKK